MSEKTIKILMIEDNSGDVRLIQEMMSKITDFQYDLEWADGIAKGLNRLAEAHFDVVLLDLSLPDTSSLQETFMHLQDPILLSLPVIVLTGTSDESLGAQAVQSGAEDYLIKDKMDSHLLARVIRYALERKDLEETLRVSVTKQKRVEAGLKKCRASFYNTIEKSAEGILVVDQEGIVRFTNRALAAMLGRTKEELSGELFGFPVMSGESTEIDIIRRCGEIGVGEMRVVETEWEKEPAYLIAIRDVTDHKRGVEEMKRKNAELQRLSNN
jgi:CheY-like chemotaxis protein